MPTKKRQRTPEPPKPVVYAPGAHVHVTVQSTQHEGGSDGGSYGDVLIQLSTRPNSNRYDIAEQLRRLADHIAATHGDPMVAASITVLMRRPR